MHPAASVVKMPLPLLFSSSPLLMAFVCDGFVLGLSLSPTGMYEIINVIGLDLADNYSTDP